MAICVICEERELSPRSKLPACNVCRGNMGYWKKMPPARAIGYRRQLQVRTTRMSYVNDDKLPKVEIRPYLTPAERAAAKGGSKKKRKAKAKVVPIGSARRRAA